jgi:tRNA(Ile)-lysidine synthase
MESTMKHLPTNRSARFRAVRLRFFRREVDAHRLMGVILAHHAGDQAETVFQRLLRGSGYSGLVGMSRCASVAGVKILRPLLEVRRSALREHLRAIGQDWREDASNASNHYQRNRVRRMLEQCAMLPAPLIEMSNACRKLRDWARSSAPVLAEQFPVTALQGLPDLLADESARRWLVQRGIPSDEIVPEVVARLLEMVNDAASAPRQDFPARVTIVRKRGVISKAHQK